MRSKDPTPGYTLLAPEQSTWAHLVAADGHEVFRWPSDGDPGQATYLTARGRLLRAIEHPVPGAFDSAKGRGGVVELIEGDGDVAWRFEYASSDHQLHHDVAPMPNGHVLMIAWERKSAAQAIAAGRDPALVRHGELWPDHVIEVDPRSDRIVWEWHVWDHIVQDRDPSKPNYGRPSDHPRRIDVNFTKSGHGARDWNHTNSVMYDPTRDQILLSVRQFSEIWVIDHSKDTRTARGPAGDLRFRWGNPAAYGRGGAKDQQLFVQHDARWIQTAGGALAFSVFNNGLPGVRQYSTVDEIVPTLTDGEFTIGSRGRFLASSRRVFPTRAGDEFFAPNTSGAQRLANGHWVVTDAPHGRVLEVSATGRVVWEYVNPYFAGDADRVPRTGAGFPVTPWRLFKAHHYAPSSPGIVELLDRSR